MRCLRARFWGFRLVSLVPVALLPRVPAFTLPRPRAVAWAWPVFARGWQQGLFVGVFARWVGGWGLVFALLLCSLGVFALSWCWRA